MIKNTFYYHNDHLATPQKMTDSSGTVVWAADYKPFGEATITVSTITNNLRFPGQYLDQETALHYNYYRDYNPAIGRYVETDPLGIRGDVKHLFGSPIIKKYSNPDSLETQKGINHLYLYVGSNPLNYTDILGLLRDCDQEQIECFRACWNRNPPWPITRGSGGHYRYCQSKCLAEYLECKAENACRQTATYCSNNPMMCVAIGVGTALIIIQPELGLLAPAL